MSPKFISGDLVLVRNQKNYSIGDVIAYSHPDIGQVFHRIIAFNENGNYLVQGDHNSWVDAYAPSQEEIIGNLWIHIPKMGKTLLALRSPWAFAILVLVFSFLGMKILFPLSKSRHNRGEKMARSTSNIGEKIFLAAILTFLSLILGIFSFQRPVLVEVTTPLSYQQQAVYRYTADVPAGIYDSEQIQPGEPIFRQLNGSFFVSMDYLFISAHPAEINGSYQLFARISDHAGWKRTLALSSKTAFSDRIFTVRGRLDLDEIQRFIDTLERETGVQRGQYSLSIVNDIRVSGTLDGIAFEEQFNPTVDFEINALEIQLSQATESEGGVLQPSSSSVLSRQSWEENSLGFFGMDLPVYLARRISLGVGIPATVGLLFLLFHVYRNTEKSELERLRLWHGHILVETRDVRILEMQQYSNLANLEALITLAEQDQRIILHLPDQGKHHFFVQTPEQLYHYEADQNKSTQNMIDVRRQSKRRRVWRLPSFSRNTNMSLAYEHALKGWANAVDRKLYKEGEADYLAEMAYKLAKRMDVRGGELENIRMAAYLHKIGLMDVPNEVLQKKKKLTEKELELIRNHPSYARKQLAGAELLKPIAEIIYYQHERWDGSGHPEGLEGEEIPLGARIISIVNIWRSLQQKRPHRDAWTEEEAKKYLHEQSGKQFDPHIVSVFLADVDINPIDFEIRDIEIYADEDRDV